MLIKDDFKTIKSRIIESNTDAAEKNRNLYPIQEQATLVEIWEYSPCECNNNCTCKLFGCENHWKLKQNLSFDNILPAFLRMFVDQKSHQKLCEWIKEKHPLPDPDKVSPRIKNLIPILIDMRDNWDELYSAILNNNKTLVCDEWHNHYFEKQWNFLVKTSVYRAKQFCILMPDICIPYDTQSRNKILKSTKISKRTNNITYFDMLNELRKWIIYVLKSENQTLQNFRKLDNPQKQLPYNPYSILLKKNNFDYGDIYTPDERPISRIVDKFFYQPSANNVSITDGTKKQP